MKLKKIVLTGAAGALGNHLRTSLAEMTDALVSTDIAPALRSEPLPGETYVQADLAEMSEIAPLMDGAEMVLHFGALVDEAPFDEIWPPNFLGAHNIFESAYRAGVRRVIYASSIHAVGMYPSKDGIDTDAPHWPDTYYGLAKVFTEHLGQMFWEKRGLESVHLRILSCTPEPQNVRALGTWLSYGDLTRLVRRAIETQVVECTKVFGVSANTRAPVSNARVGFLGYDPRDNAEDWAEELFAKAQPVDPADIMHQRVGGPFAKVDIGESGIAMLKRLTEGG